MTARVLLLGGIDPCGGAGITADATVVARHGAQPLPIAIVLTVQNRRGFRHHHEVSPDVWRAAFDAAVGDGEVHAVKLGMLGLAAAVRAVAEALHPLAGRVPIVVDPVLSATAGGFEPPAALAAAYRQHLLPLATVFTPNLPEAEAVLGAGPSAAFAAGCRSVLRKGGHATGDFVEDVLFQPSGATHFRRPRLHVGPVHGTGCALASGIAAGLALGLDVESACREAGSALATLLEALGPPAADGLPRPLPLGDWPAPVRRTSPR